MKKIKFLIFVLIVATKILSGEFETINKSTITVVNNSKFDNIFITLVGNEILSGELFQIPDGRSLKKGTEKSIEALNLFEWIGIKITAWQNSEVLYLTKTIGQYPSILKSDCLQINSYITTFDNPKKKEELEILKKGSFTTSKNIKIDIQNVENSIEQLKVIFTNLDTNEFVEIK